MHPENTGKEMLFFKSVMKFAQLGKTKNAFFLA